MELRATDHQVPAAEAVAALFASGDLSRLAAYMAKREEDRQDLAAQLCLEILRLPGTRTLDHWLMNARLRSRRIRRDQAVHRQRFRSLDELLLDRAGLTLPLNATTLGARLKMRAPRRQSG